jgi:hypothetical protein
MNARRPSLPRPRSAPLAAGAPHRLARASGIALARAIFTAALSERPDRRITVRRSTRILADSAG